MLFSITVKSQLLTKKTDQNNCVLNIHHPLLRDQDLEAENVEDVSDALAYEKKRLKLILGIRPI
jgi:hypothetical protein